MRIRRRACLRPPPLRRAALLSFLIASFLFTPSVTFANDDDSDEKAYASSNYKAPNPSTPPHLVSQWSSSDAALWSYVSTHVPAVLDHTGSAAFDQHLKGVQAVLRHWNSPEHLTNAGLFHSIYGTEGFQGFSLPLSERSVIKELIGDKAERLCWMFCMVDRYTVDETVFAWTPPAGSKADVTEEQQPPQQQKTSGFMHLSLLKHLEASNIQPPNENTYAFKARPELGRFTISLSSKDEWLDFLELTLADWLEQVEGAAEAPSERFNWEQPGEAYAYRRTAYAKMAAILSVERPDRLSNVVKDMLKDVMDTEGSETRHLVQLRTPPMSDAAKEALEAMKSAGVWDGAEDQLWPRPLMETSEERRKESEMEEGGNDELDVDDIEVEVEVDASCT